MSTNLQDLVFMLNEVEPDKRKVVEAQIREMIEKELAFAQNQRELKRKHEDTIAAEAKVVIENLKRDVGNYIELLRKSQDLVAKTIDERNIVQREIDKLKDSISTFVKEVPTTL